MNPELDSFLDKILDADTATVDSEPVEPASVEVDFLDTSIKTPTIVPLAEGQIDPRLKLLSNSSCTLLHKCPRKYQLYRLSSSEVQLKEEKRKEQGVTFAYGKAVGVGIQAVFEGKTEDEVYLAVLLAWDVNLLDENPRQKKSFWEAMFAVQKFMIAYNSDYLEDYDLVYYKGKPAVELSFRVHIPSGFTYRGYVDAVLQNKHTKEILVLECKTTSGKANSTMYKNSGQGIGYSIVLDKLFPKLSSYKVFYLVYETKTREYVEFYFDKSLLQRALWLQELIIDTKQIELYEDYKTYPMHGETCLDFFRDCEYLGICTLNTANIAKPLTEKILKDIAEESYMFEVSFMDLVEAQLEKGQKGELQDET